MTQIKKRTTDMETSKEVHRQEKNQISSYEATLTANREQFQTYERKIERLEHKDKESQGIIQSLEERLQ